MVTEIRVYYEGNKLLQSGFAVFFNEVRQRARERRCSFHLIPSGSRSNTCQDFGIALKANPNAWNILLIDSEGPHEDDLSLSLCDSNHWNRSHAGSIFWMVEMMEAWFHADKDALEQFYGKGFKRQALRPSPKVEEIPKKDLEDGLENATKDTRKGSYYDHKTSHGPKLLAAIRPDLVQSAAPNCRKLFAAMLEKLSPS